MKTEGSAKVLIDTSAWIAFFRKEKPLYEKVSALMDDDLIVCCGIVYAELLQGVKTEKELSSLKDFLHVFEFPEEHAKLWEEAGELSFRLRKKGKSPGLADCYIAVLARRNGYSILTLDGHFKDLTKEAGIACL